MGIYAYLVVVFSMSHVIRLKPSDGLQNIWKRECRIKCEKYWWITKAIPISRYKRCIQTCIDNKIEKERPTNKR